MIEIWERGGFWHAQVEGLVLCADTVDALVELLWGATRQ